MSKFKDLFGMRFAYLTVLARAENNINGNTQWRCRCDCGNEKIITASALTSNSTQSCGCRKQELKKSNQENGLEKKIFNALKSLRKSVKELSINNDHERKLLNIYGSQIAILESLDPKFRREGEVIYENEAAKY